MTTKEVHDKLYSELKKLGAIRWHNSMHDSYYIKFRDARLGSIRIADHPGRKKYSYKYKIFTKNNKNIEKEINTIIGTISTESFFLTDFDPKQYKVFCEKEKKYIILPNYESYRKHILTSNKG